MAPEISQLTFHQRHEKLTQQIYSGALDLPARYVFVITNICNLDCSFCFQDRIRRSDAMTSDEWINLIDQLPEYARVTLTGGEPLAFKEFERVFLHVTRKFQCNMISNGLLLNEKKIDLLLSQKNFKVLSVSIDDIGNISRDVKPAQWDRFLKAIKYFHKRRSETGSDCILDIKTVVLDETASELFDIHQYCVEVLNCNTHVFQFLKGSPLQHSDRMSDLNSIFMTSEAVTYKNDKIIWDQLEKVRLYGQASKCDAYVHPKFCDLNGDNPVVAPEFLNKPSFNPDDFKPCKFPWSSVHVNVDGHLFPCLSISMGNVKDETLNDIIQGEKFTEFRRIISENLVQGCNRCGWIRDKNSNVE